MFVCCPHCGAMFSRESDYAEHVHDIEEKAQQEQMLIFLDYLRGGPPSRSRAS
jgi:hypothetical protein